MKKIIVLVLAVLMSLSSIMFYACGSSSGYDPSNFLTVEEATALGNPYQIVKNPVEIRIFVPRGASNPEYSSMRMFTTLSELTNLKFKFIEADEDQYMNQRSLAWEDKSNLPDLFLYRNTVSELVMYSEYKALTTFNDPNYSKSGVTIGSLIDNYMPNYKALLNNNFGLNTTETVKNICTLSNGFMYSTATVRTVPRDLTFKMYINEQWIKNINEDNANVLAVEGISSADDIHTIEDYINVLRAFKQYDANRNGRNDDEIPVTAESMNYLRNFILGSYGSVSNGIEIKNDGSEFQYTPATESYAKYLETARIMYVESLLDNNVFSNTSTSTNDKGSAGKLGSFSAAAAYVVVGDTLDEQYTTLGALTSGYYTGSPVYFSYLKVDPLGAVIPSNSTYSREVARLLDIMYSELGVELQTFGKEGIDWKWTDATKSAWEKTVPSTWNKSEEEYRATLTPNVGLGVCLFNDYEFVKKEVGSYTTKLNKLAEKYYDNLKEPIPSYIKLTSQEYDTEAKIGASLEPKIKEWERKFIIGEKTVGNDWQSFITEISGYRYSELEDIYNGALTRYKNSK